MKNFVRQISLTSLVLIVAGCAEAKTKSASTPARSTSSKFEGIGRVAYHRGQPCAAPIMFDFNVGFGQTVWLAAGFKDEKILADAAAHHRRVRVFGNWRRGNAASCRYISVSKVER